MESKEFSEEPETSEEDNPPLNLEEIINYLAEDAKEMLGEDFEGFVFDSNGDFVDAPEELYWQTAANIFDLALRYKRNPGNYYNLGHALLNLAIYKPDEEKISILRDSISNLKEAEKINPNYRDAYLLGRAHIMLGDSLDDHEKSRAYSISEEYYKDYLKNDPEELKEADAYYDLGRIIKEAADELDEAINFQEKIDRRREGIIYLQKAVRLDPENELYHCVLGEELASLARDTPDTGRKKRRYNLALNHMQKSYKIDKDPSKLELIEEIKGNIL